MSKESSPLLSSAPVKASKNEPVAICGDKLWQVKALYVCQSGMTSALNNFMPVFFEKNDGLSKLQIGVLQTIPCVCATFAPPIWGAFADRFQAHRALIVVTLIGASGFLYLLQFFPLFYAACALVFLSNCTQNSLLDHAIMSMITTYGGEYGKQRLFGAVGWGATAYVTGLVVAAYGISWSFNINVLLMLAGVFVLRFLPNLHEDEEEAAGDDNSASFWDGLRTLARDHKDMLVLMGVVFLMGLMFGVLSSFLTLNLYNLSGGNAHIIGVAIMCETISELPAFFYSQKLIDKLGIVNVLLLSISAYFLRITYYAIMVNPWTAIPFEFLHGVTFGIAWAACTQYVFDTSPRSVSGTTLGMLNAVQNGLGKGAGTIVGGWIYDNYGARTMWWITDLGVPISLVGVFVFAMLKKRQQVESEETIAKEVV